MAWAQVRAKQVGYYLRERGVTATVRRIVTFVAGKTMPREANSAKPAFRPAVPCIESLNLQPGDWVVVKSWEEIQQTFDGEARNRGLVFTDEMAEYCGQRLRVMKRVRQICMETRPNEMRRLSNTVILEGAYCKGGTRGCDRAAFFFWREAWLNRCDGPPPENR